MSQTISLRELRHVRQGHRAGDDPDTIYLPPSCNKTKLWSMFTERCSIEYNQRKYFLCLLLFVSTSLLSVDAAVLEDEDVDLHLDLDRERPPNYEQLRHWSYPNFCKQMKTHFSHVRYFHAVWGECDKCRKYQAGLGRLQANPASGDRLSIFQDEEQAQRVNSDSEEDEEELRLEEMDLGDNEEEVESRVMQTQEERIGRVIHHREVC